MLKFPKPNRTRLKGKKLIDLYQRVYECYDGMCAQCGGWVEPGTIPHHIIHKSQGGSDTMDNLILLCMECHDKEHN